MSVNSVTNSSLWMSQLIDYNQDAQQNQSSGSDTQSIETVDLKTFLTTLKQNLQNFMTPISATGNLINTSE